MFEFASPWALVLLAGLPFVAWRMFARDASSAVTLSTAFRAQQLRPTWRQRTMWIIRALQLLALALIIVALARPRSGVIQRPFKGEGVAIQFAIDRSGSMERDDFELGGARVTRLDAVKAVVGRFFSDETMLGNRSDLVGLVTFAQFAERVAPLTVDSDFVIARLNETKNAGDFREDGTAIGDALGLAVASLDDYESQRTVVNPGRPLQKVVVLLTDGEQNAGEITALEAAALANAVDVTVHVIGIRPPSSQTGEAPGAGTLREVAEQTGGRYYEASDTETLAGICGEIAQLEQTDVGPAPYRDYREWAIDEVRTASIVFPPVVLVSLVLFAASMLLRHTVYRTIP